jgi:hypothetical protein
MAYEILGTEQAGRYELLPPSETAQRIDNDAISQGARTNASDSPAGRFLSLLGGGIRGAGSIGATLARPFESGEENAQRRARLDENMRGMGADPNSWLYKGGKLGAEIAGTAGIGGALAKPVQALAGTRMAAGVEPLLEGVAKGLQSGGFRVGDLAGTGAGTVARLATGAATGAASAGLVNPEDAGSGAVIGGLLPGAVQLAGSAGRAFRGTATAPNPVMAQTAQNAMREGYIIPPATLNPSYANRLLESQSGKIETAQMAATKNQEVTENLVRRALNLPKNSPLTQDVMAAYRTQQYQAGYEPVKQLGMIPAGKGFSDALDKVVQQYTGKGTIPAVAKKDVSELVQAHRSAGFDSADAVEAIKILREDAGAAFRSGNTALAKANRAIADAYEGAIDDTLKATGQQDLLGAYRAARQNLAKAFTVEKAIVEGSGGIKASKLAAELQKGKPLSGDLKTVAEFANTFPRAAQAPQQIGSPGVFTLRNILSPAIGAGGAAAFGPAGLLLGGLNYASGPVARSLMFNPRFQRGLLSQPVQTEMSPLLANALRTAPVAANQ